MGKWKCLWCSKVLEGESFMNLVEASMKEEGGQHVHGWQNIILAQEEAALPEKSKLISFLNLEMWSNREQRLQVIEIFGT
jgi:hypothetical protein